MNEENEDKVEVVEGAAEDITETVVDENNYKSPETDVELERVETEAKDETRKPGEQLAGVEFETEAPQHEMGIFEVKTELGSSKKEAGYQPKDYIHMRDSSLGSVDIDTVRSNG